MMLLWRYQFMEATTGGYLWSQWMVGSDEESEEDFMDIAVDLVGDFGTVSEIQIMRQ